MLWQINNIVKQKPHFSYTELLDFFLLSSININVLSQKTIERITQVPNSMQVPILWVKLSLMLYINSQVKDMSLAEELTLDTFTKLTVKRPRFRGEGSFKTWLYTIGRNLAIDTLRKRKNYVPLDEV